MQCSYCRAWNEEENHRCHRCGRRVDAHALRPIPRPAQEFQISGAAAHARDLDAEVHEPAPRIEPAQRGIYDDQPSLFSHAPKVVPIPTLTPVRAAGPTPKKARPSGPRGTGHRKHDDNQSLLEFEIPSTPPRHALRTSVEAVIFCDAPVAIPAHRILATVVDTSMILFAVGIFVVLCWFAGGELAFNKQTLPLLGTAVVLFALFYHALWCLANGDTIGMRAARLRLVDFDGRRPTRAMRGMRLGMSLISISAAGLGLLWALVDEESLTWHDHATKTFPTLDHHR